MAYDVILLKEPRYDLFKRKQTFSLLFVHLKFAGAS